MQTRLKILFICVLLSILGAVASGQVTYTWNVASGDWTTPGSWNPSRSVPAANDILIFDGSVESIVSVTNVPKETIGQLGIINGCAVTFASGTATLGTGTISRTATTVTGTGTSFTSELAVGDLIYGNTTQAPYDVAAIASNTSLTTTQSGTVSSQTFSVAPKLTIAGGNGRRPNSKRRLFFNDQHFGSSSHWLVLVWRGNWCCRR